MDYRQQFLGGNVTILTETQTRGRTERYFEAELDRPQKPNEIVTVKLTENTDKGVKATVLD